MTSTDPSENLSLAAVSSWPSACSGDLYSSEPISQPVRVNSVPAPSEHTRVVEVDHPRPVRGEQDIGRLEIPVDLDQRRGDPAAKRNADCSASTPVTSIVGELRARLL